MMRCYGRVLIALGFVMLQGTAAWAEGAAKQEASSGLAWLTLLIFMSPFFLIMIWAFRGARRQMGQVNRSLDMNEEILTLARQQLAMQAETNRLLGQLIEVVSRDRD